MAHISRKELKKDEIRDTLAHGAEAVIGHQGLTGIILTVAAVVALAVFGWRWYAERQTAQASVALEQAMKIFEARIRPAFEPAIPNEVTYVEEKNKYEDAAKKFNEIAGKYSRTRPGQISRYYAALSEIHLGRFDDAQKELNRVAASGDEEFAALARFQLAGVYDRTGKPDEAVKLYRQLADKPTVLVPKPLVLLALADHFRKTNPQQATELYNQIKKDFADSPLADEADKRLESLTPKT